MARIAVLSYHTSPLAQPGTGDGGGMNVYVREMGAALARHGHDVVIYTRRDNPVVRDRVHVEPGLDVVNVTAGPAEAVALAGLSEYVDQFADAVAVDFNCGGAPDAIHANYWLSGIAGHRLKHEFDIPLITTFHTLEKIKAATFDVESEGRSAEESRIIGCSDAVLASCDVEARQIVDLYDANPARIHIVPLGVERAFFSPGTKAAARAAIGLNCADPVFLFAGRIQALKGVDLAVDAFIEYQRRNNSGHLAIVGGPSGPGGLDVVRELHHKIEGAGLVESVAFVAPQSHQMLSTWFRAADVTLVPSHSESFGLVALESMSCGTPIVASAVGGLTTLVDNGVNGRLMERRDPIEWADALEDVLEPARALALREASLSLASNYTWCRTAGAVASIVTGLTNGSLLRCPA